MVKLPKFMPPRNREHRRGIERGRIFRLACERVWGELQFARFMLPMRFRPNVGCFTRHGFVEVLQRF